MIWLAAGSVAALAIVTLAALQTISRMLRAQARERDLLLNQIMHLAGRTWTPPPSAAEPDPDAEPADERYTYAPSQLPDQWGDET